ncbi:MAG TPA: hypothetical protein VEB86_03380, partial [Chryseosolibacter sp.]|nr:hypothetical protein [Chryseosolibacter sp.]
MILLAISIVAHSQTPGLIFKSAGSGASVLDPDNNGYTSTSASGFVSNDQAESEIPYKALVVPDFEPVADPGPGPDCGFTDIVDSGAEDPVFMYYDATGQNLLFRFRLGNSADNSKGYSLLVDADQKFGFSGANADPDAVSGNAGFEFEIVLRTNFGVDLYDVGGTTTPVQKGTTLAFDNYAQKSIALTTNCSTPDYFYDFYIPFSVITTYFPSITTSTPLRIVAVTSMSPAPAIGNNAVSDVGGIDDSAYGYNFDKIFQDVIDNYTPTSVTGTPLDRSECPAISAPVNTGAPTVSGTSTEIGATVKVFKGTGTLTQIGTATVNNDGTWTAAVSAVSTGDVISATATNTNEGESYSNCSQVTVTNCSPPVPPYNLTRESNRKYISGTATPGGTIKVYTNPSGTYVLSSGSFTLASNGDGTFCWVPGIDANTCSPPNGSGLLTSGTTYYVTQTVNGCESAKAPICVSNQVSTNPTLTQTALTTATTTLSGTSGSNAAITVYANGVSIATTTASGTAWSATVNLSSYAGQFITITAVETSKCIATALSAGVVVTAIVSTSATPTLSGSYCATASGSLETVFGTSSEADGTMIILYANGVAKDTAEVYNSTWAVTTTLNGGDVLTAKATASGENQSAASNSVTVGTSNAAPSVTFSTPIIEGATSISGSFTGSGTLKIYIDGALLGSTTSNSFTISGLGAFDVYAGGLLTASLTSGGCESAETAGVTVACQTPAVSLSVLPLTATVCAGETSSVDIKSEDGIIYQLYNGLTASGVSALGTGDTITLVSGTLTSSTTLKVKAMKISAVSCVDTLTNRQTVTVNPVIASNSV